MQRFLAGVVLLGGLTVGEASIPRNSATFPIAHRTAPGASSLAVTLDSQSVNDLYYDPTDSAGHWLAFLTLNPGPHTLSVNAFTNSVLAGGATNTFTSLGTPQTAVTTYDGRGHAIKRVFLSNGSQQTQTLSWDGAGRLTAVSQRDQTSNNGYDWTALYDGLGRRLRTVYTPVDGGVACPKLSVTQESWYDPEVEFLELGVSVNGQGFWKLYGPDLNGAYGGLQGVGGLEAVIRQSDGVVTPLISDAFGNVVAGVSGTNISWNTTRVGGYGPLPRTSAKLLGPNVSLAEATVWRGKRIDQTGYYWLGARPYDPVAGRFLSPDPLGHEASMDLYSYANGDPINECDPDGRFGKNAVSSWQTSITDSFIESAKRDRQAEIDQPIQYREVEGPNYYVSTPERWLSGALHALPGSSTILGAIESFTGSNPLTLEPADRGGAAMAAVFSVFPMGGAGGGVGRGGVSAFTRGVARTEIGVLARAPVVAARGGEQVFQRVVSNAELAATLNSGLLRGGREGRNFFSSIISLDAKRAQIRLGLDGPLRDARITFRIKGDVPVVGPGRAGPGRSGTPGRGVEFHTDEVTPIEILGVDPLRK